jgi:hypothetical protein
MNTGSAAAGVRQRWLLVGLVVGFLLLLGLWAQDQAPGGREITGEHTEPYLLGNEALAVALAMPVSSLQRVSPPIDVGAIERGAARLPMADVPLPGDRAVRTHRDHATGLEVTQALLWYPAPADAQRLDELASQLLGMAFQLRDEPAHVAGAESARRWTADAYSGVSFRKGGYVAFVGASAAAMDLAPAAAALLAALPATPPATP